MILVTPTEFRAHLKRYLDLAVTETVRLKGNNGVVFDIVPSKEVRLNPSPSNDPWFDNPRNMAELNLAKEELRSGKADLKELSDAAYKMLFSV